MANRVTKTALWNAHRRTTYVVDEQERSHSHSQYADSHVAGDPIHIGARHAAGFPLHTLLERNFLQVTRLLRKGHAEGCRMLLIPTARLQSNRGSGAWTPRKSALPIAQFRGRRTEESRNSPPRRNKQHSDATSTVFSDT